MLQLKHRQQITKLLVKWTQSQSFVLCVPKPTCCLSQISVYLCFYANIYRQMLFTKFSVLYPEHMGIYSWLLYTYLCSFKPGKNIRKRKKFGINELILTNASESLLCSRKYTKSLEALSCLILIITL